MTMDHEEIETLLGAYALDAVDPDEARAIEEHLATCPRCRAELAAHLEVATLLGNTGSEAPHGLWDRIADQLDESTVVASSSALIARLPRQKRRMRFAMPALAAAAVIAVVALSFQVAHLDHEVNHPPGTEALAPAVDATLASAHSTVTLTSATTKHAGTIIVGKDGTGYWISSDLPPLSAERTYQLWGLVHGRAVSLGLLGADAQRYSAFRVQPGTSRLMVTAEPEGGTPAPTGAVVVTAATPHLV
jgi:anti-sigma factor RsiW